MYGRSSLTAEAVREDFTVFSQQPAFDADSACMRDATRLFVLSHNTLLGL